MRTNIDLDDLLIKEAFKHSNYRSKREIVHAALQEFVAARTRPDIQTIKGKITFSSDYDYKALRRGS